MTDDTRPTVQLLPLDQPTPQKTAHELLGLPNPANPNVRRDAKGRILPGQSLNPSGARTSLPVLMKRIVDANGGFEQATQVLCDIAWGKLAPGARLADRMRAIEILYDRVFGKAREHVTVDDGSKASSNLQGKPLAELIGMRQRLRALRQGDGDVQEAQIVEPDQTEH